MQIKKKIDFLSKKHNINIIFQDTGNPRDRLIEVIESDNKAVLTINNNFEYLIIGPLYKENPGCHLCLNDRFLNTRRDRAYLKKNNRNDSYTPNILYFLPNNIVDILIPLIINEGEQGFQKATYIFNKETLEITKNYLTPIPDCDVCSVLPLDNEHLVMKSFEETVNTLSSNPFVPMRSTHFLKLRENVEKIALNKFTGIFNVLLKNNDGPFPVAVANLPLKNGKDEVGVGRTDNMEESQAVALLEGMERYAGMQPRGKKTKVLSTYKEIKDYALDPRELILHSDSIKLGSPYNNNHFRFSDDQAYHWIWGYNLLKREPVLVPETYAYYGLNLKDKKYITEQFAYEISNGCALGSTLLESAFYGLLEVVERDAFLTSWYFGNPVIEIKVGKEFLEKSSKLSKVINQFNSYYKNYELSFYDISTDTKIPVILATVHSKEYKNEEMNFMCAAAAHPNILEAMEKSLHEISGIFFGLQIKFKERYSSLLDMVNDPSKILSMEDHSLVYGMSCMKKHVDFKARIKQTVFIEELMDSKEVNLKEEMNKSLEILKGLSKEVIIVDQTTEEMNKMNIRCTKTIIPGLLPMTFGSHNIRVSKKRVTETEKFHGTTVNLNFNPHPFP